MEMRDPPKRATLLRVIKPLVWNDGQKLAEESGCPLKVGDKTWTINWHFHNTHLEDNKWLINFDKSCFEEITEEEFKKISNEELSDEELLEIAKEKYPAGTVYNALCSDGSISREYKGSEVTVTSPQMLASGIDAGPGYIYSKATKQWAEIVPSVKSELRMESSDKELLKIAAAKYPIGTKYKGIYDDGSIESGYSESERQPKFYQERKFIDVGSLYCYNRETNTWAEVINDEEPVEIKKQLPETGLLVSKHGSIIYRINGSEGFGFDSEKYKIHSGWSFISNPNNWRIATPEDEAKFIVSLRKEADKRGLDIEAKIKRHADNSRYPINEGNWSGSFTLKTAYNKHGQIFDNGIWAEPLIETPSQPEPQRTSEEEVEPRYRIKTKEEFERDGRMVDGHPINWNMEGKMDVYYGQLLPKSYYLEGLTFFLWEGWSFNVEHDIVKVTDYPLTPSEALGKTSTLGDISYQRDIEIEKVKKENVKRDFTPMKNIV